MQLVRNRLHAATCALLAIAGSASAEGDWHVEAAAMNYSEQGRITVVEPYLRVQRNLPNGQTLAAKVILDAITGASPNGAMPTDHPQTFTTASGRAASASGSGEEEHHHGPTIVAPGETPTLAFQDHRASLDLDYDRPLARTLKATLGGHLSAESDYVSRGLTGTVNWETPNRLTTLTAGVGANFDQVNPKGGKPEALVYADSSGHSGSASKHEVDGMLGITRVLSRRWLVQLNYGRAQDNGYLTEPYKVVSILDSLGSTVNYRDEKRPDTRTRQNFFLSSAYQLKEDVIHVSYRYYWDDWGIQSHTVDLKYRYELANRDYFEPHIRYYTQTAVNFYSYGLMAGAPLPNYATSDYRFGKMATTTIGLKFGIPMSAGELNFRAEYMRQSGDQHPGKAVGVQRNYNLFPAINSMILQIGYTIDL